MLVDQRLDLVLPGALAVAHAHRHRVVEAHAGLGGQRYHDQFGRAHPLGEVAGDRAPHDGGVDLAGGQVLLEDLAGVLVGVRVHDRIGHGTVHELVLREPLRGRRAVVDADAQARELLRIELEEVVGRLHRVHAAAFGEHQRVGRAVVRLGGRHLVEAGRHAHHDVAAIVLAGQLVAQRVADECQTLRERVVLHRQPQLACEQLRDAVLVAIALDAGEGQVVRVLADAERLARRRLLGRGGHGAGQQQRRRTGQRYEAAQCLHCIS